MIRKPSCNELLYTDLQDYTNSFAIQYVFKLKKIENIPAIEEAVNEVLKANPGVNVYLKNGGYFASEKKVSIREYKVSDDDLFNN
ncbi:MAG: hypothetical protein K5776_03010, partial [Lachnospiraceae bacterium]|nr:hypothetical protein [Lachnospiraceae bacterium]